MTGLEGGGPSSVGLPKTDARLTLESLGTLCHIPTLGLNGRAAFISYHGDLLRRRTCSLGGLEVGSNLEKSMSISVFSGLCLGVKFRGYDIELL